MAGILLNRNRQVPAEETPAFGGIAERFRRAGDLDRAIALCRDGLKRFPDQLSARVTLGWALLDKGQYDAARAELEQVLRRAPDNLAAIRGLAELHDRSEGAISSAEQESWRTADAAAVEENAEGTASDVPSIEADPLAPIQVAFSGPEESSPEIVHTASQAGFTSDDSAVLAEPAELLVTPVELEDAAAASMAAATEPSPFFVDSAEALLESAASAAVSAFDTGDSDSLADVAATMELDAVGSSAETLLDGAQTPQFSSWDEAGELAAAVMAETGPELLLDPVPVEDATSSWQSSSDWNPEDVAAGSVPVAALETLDDVDEEAGMELADAIKALERAAKRVESKFAVPHVSMEPVDTDEVGAFDFSGAAPIHGQDDADVDALVPRAESLHEGSFELVAPDLASVELAPTALESDEVEGVGDAPAADAYPAAFAFDAPVEDVLENYQVGVTDLSADAHNVDDGAGAGNDDIEATVALLEQQAGAAFAALEVAPVDEAALSPDAELADEAYVVASAEIAEVAEVEAEAEVEEEAHVEAPVEDAETVVVRFARPAPDVDVRLDEEQRPELIDGLAEAAFEPVSEAVFDSEVDDAPVAADAGDEVAADDEVETQIAALVETETAEQIGVIFTPLTDTVEDEAAVEVPSTAGEIYGVFAGTDDVEPELAVAVFVDAVAEPEVINPARVRQQKTLAALQRFLRQVQARRLELQSETVA